MKKTVYHSTMCAILALGSLFMTAPVLAQHSHRGTSGQSTTRHEAPISSVSQSSSSSHRSDSHRSSMSSSSSSSNRHESSRPSVSSSSSSSHRHEATRTESTKSRSYSPSSSSHSERIESGRRNDTRVSTSSSFDSHRSTGGSSSGSSSSFDRNRTTGGSSSGSSSDRHRSGGNSGSSFDRNRTTGGSSSSSDRNSNVTSFERRPHSGTKIDNNRSDQTTTPKTFNRDNGSNIHRDANRGNDRGNGNDKNARPDNNRDNRGNFNNNRDNNERGRDRGGNFNNRGNNDRGGNHRGGNDRGGNFNNRGNNDRGGNHGGGNFDRGRDRNHGGFDRGYPGGGQRHDYSRYRYNDHFKPRHNDRFFSHYSAGWRHPILPPVRHHRPHHIWFYRPTIPVSFQVYLSAPSIDGIFGLYFGTSMTSSLDYLYYSGYNIDGYYDNIVYLRDANLMNYSWPDVMLSFDEYNNFEYAQFSIASTYYDVARFNSLKSRLRATYGTPVSVTRDQITWIGGNRHGYVTLSMNYDNGLYFTSLSFGY